MGGDTDDQEIRTSRSAPGQTDIVVSGGPGRRRWRAAWRLPKPMYSDNGTGNTEWLAAHGAFHAALAAAGSPILERRRRQLYDASELNRMWSGNLAQHPTRTHVSDEHKAIFEAALARDAECTVDRLTRHLETTARQLASATIAPGANRSEGNMSADTTSDRAAHRPPLHHPVVIEHAAKRAASLQLRIADRITTFAGSMPFVYLHVVVFAVWMLSVESDPWPRLTLIVSLEAIFLSTFVMIGQNRQAEFQRAKADHDFATEATELRLNTDLTRTIHALTREIHQRVVPSASAPDPSAH